MESSDKRIALDKRLDALIDDEIERGLRATQAVQRQAAAKGAFNSGGRMLREFETLRESFQAGLTAMARLIYHAQVPNGSQVLQDAASRMRTRYAAHGSQVKSTSNLVEKLNSEFQEKLDQDIKNAITDLGFGMAGGEPLSKDTGPRNVMINSPHGTQAAAGRDVHQNVLQNTYAALIQHLDGIPNSDEFEKLDGDQQEDVRDLIETVREAANEQEPDPKKVERRGNRLVAAMKQLGMMTAAGGLVEVLKALATSGAVY